MQGHYFNLIGSFVHSEISCGDLGIWEKGKQLKPVQYVDGACQNGHNCQSLGHLICLSQFSQSQTFTKSWQSLMWCECLLSFSRGRERAVQLRVRNILGAPWTLCLSCPHFDGLGFDVECSLLRWWDLCSLILCTPLEKWDWTRVQYTPCFI